MRYNLHTLDKNQLMILGCQLHSLKTSSNELFTNSDISINGYTLDEWIADIKSKYETLNIKTEETRLKLLEEKLHNLLTIDTKVSIEIR